MAEPAHMQTQGAQNQYRDPLDRFWSLYLLDADKEDARMAERWKGDADGILIFTGLFATTVGSFIIATYPNLQPSSADQSAAVLLVMAQQLGQVVQLLASPDTPPLQSPLDLKTLETFVVPPPAIKVNILWILSFFISLFCALLATLVQQWSRTYIADTHRRGSPRSRGAIHSFLRDGVERFGFNHAVDAIITLLHVSVLLFTAGFLVLMFSINDLIAHTLLCAVVGASALYLVVTVLPMLFPDCPYSTPLTLAIQIFARYPSSAAFRIIKQHHPFQILENRIYNKLGRSYHFFKRLSFPGRQHAFALCHTESSYQRPVHVLNQMVASLDEDDEIFDFVTLLPHYLDSLVYLDFNVRLQLWSQFSHKENLQPLLDRLMKSFHPGFKPILVLTPRKPEQLTRLVLLANAAGVDNKNPSAIVSSEGRWINSRSTMRVCSHLTRRNSGQWYYLVDTANPTVRFLSHCLLSSIYVLVDLGEKQAIEDTDFMNSLWNIAVAPYELRHDRLASSLARVSQAFLSVYRLLFFIRVLLHYAALPEDPVVNHQDIWLPVLKGLRDLTLNLDFGLVPRCAHTAVWRVFSIIGRDDLVPPLGLEPWNRHHGRRLNYAGVFEQYPVIGDILGQLANALTTTRESERIQHRKTITEFVQMHDHRGKAREFERDGPGSRQRRYSFPMQDKAANALPAPDENEIRRLHLKLKFQRQDHPVSAPVQGAQYGPISSRLRYLIRSGKRSKLRDEEATGPADSLNSDSLKADHLLATSHVGGSSPLFLK